MPDLLLSERRGAAAILTFNRPDKHNALSSELLKALENALRELDDDDSVRGIVLTGNDRAFSTGADLGNAVQTAGPKATARLLAFFAHTNTIIEDLTKPVVAAINGYCLTGGLEVALACDIRIAGNGAKFGITSSKIGSVAGAGGTQRLPRVVGMEWAKEILFSADFYDAQTAHRIGLVSEVVAPEEVVNRAVARIERYAERAPLSVWYAKKAVNVGMQMELAEALEFERLLTSHLWTTADRIEGMRAFLEKRQAEFKGQ
jgi:enoyl-CoA hydratase/carnithine racemase